MTARQAGYCRQHVSHDALTKAVRTHWLVVPQGLVCSPARPIEFTVSRLVREICYFISPVLGHV